MDTGIMTYPVKMMIKIDENCVAAFKSLKQNRWTYLYNEKIDWNYLCVVINFLLKSNLIPEMIFSSKSNRDQFFQVFYNGISINEGSRQLCLTESEKYIVADFSDAPISVWNGRRGRIKFEAILPENKIIIKPKLIKRWDEDSQQKSDLVIYIKTLSKAKKGNILPAYYDFEDKYLKGEATIDKPAFIFVYDKEGLPRPEKIFYSRNEIITLVDDLKIKRPETTSEVALGLPPLNLENIDPGFFKSLYFGEKREFVNLFLELIWSKFSDFSKFIMPDAFEVDHFSQDGDKRNRLMVIFFEFKKALDTYLVTNYDGFTKLLKEHNEIIFNVSKEFLSNNEWVDKKIFLPTDKFFQDMFYFLYAKEFLYGECINQDFQWLSDHIKEESKRFTISEIEPLEKLFNKDNYQEKVDLPEQYGEESLEEVSCKKIILERDGQKVAMFIPIASTTLVEGATRNEESCRIRYSELEPGDKFEREYWTYGRLILKLNEEQDQLDSVLLRDIKTSENFRAKLKDYLSSKYPQIALNRLEAKIKETFKIDKTVYRGTMVSWIDTIMCPQEKSYPTVYALALIFKEMEEDYNTTGKDFINACEHIKSKTTMFDDDENKEIVSFIVKEVMVGPFKVRGENVGKIYDVI